MSLLPSRSVTPDRDMSRSPELAAFADRIARDPEFSAAVLASLATHQPELLAFISTALESLRAPPPASPAQPAPNSGIAESESPIIAELVRALAQHRHQRLYWVERSVCLGDDPRRYLSELASAQPLWGIVEARRHGDLHLHFLTLWPDDAAAERSERDWVALTGASEHGQSWDLVAGWGSFADRGDSTKLCSPNLFNIVRYCQKRTIEDFSTGCFAGLRVTLGRHTSETVTPCACGCGKPPAPRSRFASPRCSARLRQRAARARRRAAVTVSEVSLATVTPANSVTVQELSPLDRDTAALLAELAEVERELRNANAANTVTLPEVSPTDRDAQALAAVANPSPVTVQEVCPAAVTELGLATIANLTPVEALHRAAVFALRFEGTQAAPAALVATTLAELAREGHPPPEARLVERALRRAIVEAAQ